MEYLVRAIGILILLLVSVIGYFGKQAQLPESYRGLQVAKSVDEVSNILKGQSSRALNDAKTRLEVDNFPLIPSYWLLFVAVAFLLAQQDLSWATWLAVAAGLSITVAAGFDYLENYRALKILETPNITPPMVHGMHLASIAKWSFIFATVGMLASTFLWRPDSLGLIGYLILIAFVVGCAGTLDYSYYHHPFINNLALLPLLAGLVLLAFLSTFWPEKILRGF